MREKSHRPSDWLKTELGEVCQFGSGSGFKIDFQGSRCGTHPFIKVSDLSLPGNEKWIATANNWIDDAILGKLKAKLFPVNAVVFAKVGAALKLNRRRLLKRPTAIDNNMMAAIADGARVEPEFLYYFLLSLDLGRHSQDGAVPSVNQTHLSGIPLDLPPLPEQRRIAEILRTWDEAIAETERLIEAKENRRDALLAELATGRFGFCNKQKLWVEFAIRDIMTLVSRRVDWSEDATYRLITVKRACGGIVFRGDKKGSEIKTKDMYEVRAGDFVISKRQVVHGAWAMAAPQFDGAHVSKEYACFEPRADKLWMPFFDWLSRTKRLRHQALLCSYGVDIEKMVLDMDWLQESRVLIPESIAEQKRVAEVFDCAEHEIKLLYRERDALEKQKRGLMQKLLTGEWRVAVDETNAAPAKKRAAR
jgi:type I restriction enzyme, S subunit